jgi:hypothetical protein
MPYWNQHCPGAPNRGYSRDQRPECLQLVIAYFYGIGGQRLGTVWAERTRFGDWPGEKKPEKPKNRKTENPGKKWPFASPS